MRRLPLLGLCLLMTRLASQGLGFPVELAIAPAQPAASQTQPASPPRKPHPRVFTWQDVLLPEYTNYLAGLRAAGCPDDHVRRIAVSDVSRFFDEKRLHEARQYDFEWWKPIPPTRLFPPAGAGDDERVDKARASLFERLLGPNWTNEASLPPYVSGLVQNLVGPVLGALPAARLATVADICRRSDERLREYRAARFSLGEAIDPVEEARLRQQTRDELSRVLSAGEMEEFVLRNSHNAETLRQALQPFKPTREEFLAIFRALDPLQHRIQLEYGSEAALSLRQRLEHEAQCRRAVEEVLPSERFRAYLAAVDACYRRAHEEGGKLGLGQDAVSRLAELYRSQAARREKVTRDPTLNADQRSAALQDIAAEEERLRAEAIGPVRPVKTP